MTGRLASTVLFVVGYPVAIVCITRLVPMFRKRRTAWFAAHEAGTAAIIAGWSLRHDARAVIINGSWLVGVAVAWVVLGRRRDVGSRAERFK
ncbi:MAG: hypothetical protein NVS3B21_04510 [Acidimicrobiales bacterium]